MKLLDKVIGDLEAYYADEIWAIKSVSKVPDLAQYTGLSFSPSKVQRKFKPLRKDHLEALELYLDKYPELLESEEYPKNIFPTFFLWSDTLYWEFPSLRKGDILGSYYSYREEDSGDIEIYWLSIIFCSEKNKFDPHVLAFVVDVHEWAHAVVDLGRNLDGIRPLENGHITSKEISEGLAQFYTHHYLRNLNDSKYFDTFIGLAKTQPEEYRSHLYWLHPWLLLDYEDQGVCLEKYRKDIHSEWLSSTPNPYFFNTAWGLEGVRRILLENIRENRSITLEKFNELFGLREVFGIPLSTYELMHNLGNQLEEMLKSSQMD